MLEPDPEMRTASLAVDTRKPYPTVTNRSRAGPT
jgi:hypothetical protein